jgi:phenylacetate-CoA ligase
MAVARKVARLASAQAFQWLPARLVDAAQLGRLRAILRFCEERVPLYRERFRRAGVRARDLQSLADLALFPFTTREEIVEAYPDQLCYRAPRPGDVVFRTSGTSGLFMEIAYSAAAHDALDAIYLRALMATGYRPWQRIAYFWWSAEERPRTLYERLGLMHKDFLPLEPDPAPQLARLRALSPRFIYSFPSAMTQIAKLVEREGRGDLRPEGVICHGELLLPEDRREIARAFGCPVWNQYGAQEFNRLAWDCSEHDALHVDADSVRIEVVVGDRPAMPGEEGELVVTGLLNRLMPLVRYRIGDLGRLVPGPCRCGRGLPRIELTEGRKDDVVVLRDGRRVGPRVLAPRIEDVPGFSQYRLVQHTADRFELRVVVDAPPEDLDARLSRVLRDTLGPVHLDVRRVESIALNRRGKLRKIVSEVSGVEAPGDAEP